MSKTAKLIALLIMAVSLIIMPAGTSFAADDGPSAEAMIVDALVVRPLGFVSMLLGSVAFVVSSPFSAAGGNTDEALQKLVKDPADYTFKRELGDI